MSEPQKLHLVIGGELKDLERLEFRDLNRIEFVGAYASYEAAHQAWKAKAQMTVDNALARYFIVHAHKILDPDEN